MKRREIRKSLTERVKEIYESTISTVRIQGEVYE